MIPKAMKTLPVTRAMYPAPRAPRREQGGRPPPGAERADGEDGQDDGEQGTGEAVDPADVTVWHA